MSLNPFAGGFNPNAASFVPPGASQQAPDAPTSPATTPASAAAQEAAPAESWESASAPVVEKAVDAMAKTTIKEVRISETFAREGGGDSPPCRPCTKCVL